MENVAPAHFTRPTAPFTPLSKSAAGVRTPRRVLGDITNQTPSKTGGKAMPKTPKSCVARRGLGEGEGSIPKKARRGFAARASASEEEAEADDRWSDDAEVEHMHLSDTPSPLPSFIDARGREVCINLKEFPFRLPPGTPFDRSFASDPTADLPGAPVFDMDVPGLDD